MKIPNWQNRFKGLPTIPVLKMWQPGKLTTIEQDVMQKVVEGKALSQIEIYAIQSLSNYYSELRISLLKLNYSSFTKEDLENLKDYILYALNYICFISNKLTIFSTYRLVVNEWTTGENRRINHANFLKYPPLDIVKTVGKYNRANTPETNVFYSCETMDTCLKETKPPINKLVTIGIWLPKTQKPLIAFPISHSKEAAKVNRGVAKATAALGTIQYNPIMFNYMTMYFSLLASEYTKKVGHHYEYLLSSLFSERIFENQNPNLPEFRYDCIKYPSVGNDFATSNVAMRPSSLDDNFYLSKVIEFEIDEAYYDKKHLLGSPEVISLAKIKNLSESKSIDLEGNIIW